MRTHFALGIALVLVLPPVRSHGQGTLTRITFDGPPPQPPGTAYNIQAYYESGMSWTPLPGAVGFGRVGSNPTGGRPDDGTAYLQAGLGQSLTFRFIDDTAFDLLSVDLAEYSTAFQEPLTVHFIGYHLDGSIVTTDVITDGIIDGTGPLSDFQTFYLGPDFTGLTRVEMPFPGWSLDNVVVFVPEPSVGAQALLGAALLGLRFLRRSARRRKGT